MVILLTGTLDEAKSHARLAGLASGDVLIPRSGAAIDGLGLTAEDLIVEFPSWQDVPSGRRAEVERNLMRSIEKANVEVRWEKVGKPR